MTGDGHAGDARFFVEGCAGVDAALAAGAHPGQQGERALGETGLLRIFKMTGNALPICSE